MKINSHDKTFYFPLLCQLKVKRGTRNIFQQNGAAIISKLPTNLNVRRSKNLQDSKPFLPPSLSLPGTFLWGLILHHIGLLVRHTSIWMRDSQTGVVICRVCLEVIPAPRSSAVSDPSPRLSAKRPTGRNQPKLPLLIQRDRWIPSRSRLSSFLFLFVMHSFHYSVPPFPPARREEMKRRKRELLHERDYSNCNRATTVSTIAVVYCSHSVCCD